MQLGDFGVLVTRVTPLLVIFNPVTVFLLQRRKRKQGEQEKLSSVVGLRNVWLNERKQLRET